MRLAEEAAAAAFPPLVLFKAPILKASHFQNRDSQFTATRIYLNRSQRNRGRVAARRALRFSAIFPI